MVKEKSPVKREKQYPTLELKSERDIAMDFATKVYQKFDKLIKSIILFGSAVKHTNVVGSDIDIIIVVDDASIKFDDRMILWYREELGSIIRENPYQKDFHVNTVKLTTWWNDLQNGDPSIINVIRYGETLIDFGGFFNPLKALLEQGKIKPTPEAIYTCINRVPFHIARSRQEEIASIEGCYWAMIDSAQALLMSIKLLPPSTEHIALMIQEHFVDRKLMKSKYVEDFQSLYELHKKVMHGEVKNIDGRLVDEYQNKAEDFFNACMKLIKEIIQ
jgi:uncharacterized protein (UPF0332 family)/predicted nucleotidyltransferase